MSSKQQKRVGEKIDSAIAAENWTQARRLIRRELRSRPDDHANSACTHLLRAETIQEIPAVLGCSSPSRATLPAGCLGLCVYAGYAEPTEKSSTTLSLDRQLW